MYTSPDIFNYNIHAQHMIPVTVFIMLTWFGYLMSAFCSNLADQIDYMLSKYYKLSTTLIIMNFLREC